MLQCSIDRVFHALSDPTRREMIERLGARALTVSELHEPFSMSLSAIGQHLKVLEEGGLVRSRKVGRVRTVELEPAVLQAAEDWFSQHRRRWECKLDRLGVFLRDTEEKANPPKRTMKKRRKSRQ